MKNWGNQRSELLQASIDLNVQKNNLVKLTSSNKKNAKTVLNNLMMSSLNREFEVTDSLTLKEDLNLDEILMKLDASNTQLKLFTNT